MKKLLLLIAGLNLFYNGIALAADDGIDPEYLEVKIYKIAVSRSHFCTDLQVLVENDNPEYEDFLGSPYLGNANLDNGTYKCVVIEMSDVIRYASAENSTSGNCVASQQLTMDVCRSDHPDTIQLIDGSSDTCADGEQRVALYLSTHTQNDGNGQENPFIPPTSTEDNGMRLGSALIVNGATSAKFVVNGLGKIEDRGSWCEMQAPAFSFSKK